MARVTIDDLLEFELLNDMLKDGFVRKQTHPELPLAILNYTEKAAYSGTWNQVTKQCRGLIYDTRHPHFVVARPFPKFFNYGQEGAPELALDAPAVVTDKLDGSLGILYGIQGIATRGSFTSEQALHATEVWRDRYVGRWSPLDGVTYLFEIIYPDNRVVCDYGDVDDLYLLAALDTANGRPGNDLGWPGPRVETHRYASLAEALEAEPRPGAEGFVVYFPDTNERVKIKQDDYVALHRILTGTNARHVWEAAAVAVCFPLIRDPKHWGSYLGIDPARAEELKSLGDDWLETTGIPDEFYGWVKGLRDDFHRAVSLALDDALKTAVRAAEIKDRRARFEYVTAECSLYEKEVMRLAQAGTRDPVALAQLVLKVWRSVTPEPTAPFARGEAVA